MLHGSPGSGKTTLARSVSELLREAEVAHGVVDLDDLSMVYPFQDRGFARSNLTAIWPSYAAIPGIRLVLPTVIADRDELAELRAAVAGARFRVCELTAPVAVLKERVTAREPNEFWQAKLRTSSTSSTRARTSRRSGTSRSRPMSGLPRSRHAR